MWDLAFRIAALKQIQVNDFYLIQVLGKTESVKS